MGLPELHGFYKLVFDSLDILNDFTGQVVVSRREAGVRKWTSWLREDFVLPVSLSYCQRPAVSGISDFA